MNPWELIAKAIEDHPLVTVQELYEQVARGEAVMWTGERSAVLARITDGVCEIAPAGGDIEEILADARPVLEEWARENGCTEIHIQAGRRGWARVLAPYGYEEAAVILRKRLLWA